MSAMHVQFVDVWVENAIDKTNTRTLIWVLVWDFDVYFPVATCEWSFGFRQYFAPNFLGRLYRLSIGPLNLT